MQWAFNIVFSGITNAVDESLSTGKFIRASGTTLGVLNIALTGYQVYEDVSEGKYYSVGTRAAVARIAAGATFVPFVGWGVAIGNGVAVWGDEFYNYIENQYNP